jgi:putative endonuclease
MDPKYLGQLGEKIAAVYLQKRGYRILDKNYASPLVTGSKRDEIDLVAKKDGIISFIEAKSLTNGGQSSVISPEEKVDWQKQKSLSGLLKCGCWRIRFLLRFCGRLIL